MRDSQYRFAKMRLSLIPLLSLSFLWTLSIHGQQEVEDRHAYLATLNVGGRFSKDVSEAYVDTALPLLLTEDQRNGLFLHLYGESRIIDGSQFQNGSLGLSMRHLSYDLNSVIALRVHLDSTESYFGNDFARMAVGFDFLHESGVDFHFNYYFGDNLRSDDPYVARSQNVSSVATTSRTERATNVEVTSNTVSENIGSRDEVLSTSTNNVRNVPNPTTRAVERVDPAGTFARNDQILHRVFTDIIRGGYDIVRDRTTQSQRVNIFRDTTSDTTTTTNSNVTTNTTTANNQLWQQFEDSAEGMDLRAEFPLLNDLLFDGKEVLTAMVGGYHYNMRYGDDMTGMMGGLTFSPSDNFHLGLTYYDDAEYFGGEGNLVASASVSLPLDLGRRIRREGGIVPALRSGFSTRSTVAPLSHRFYHDHAARQNRVITDVSPMKLMQSTTSVIGVDVEEEVISTDVVTEVVAVAEREERGAISSETTTETVSSNPEETLLTVFRDKDISPDVNEDGTPDPVKFVSNGATTYNTTPTTEAGAVAEDDASLGGSFTDPVNGTTFTFTGTTAAAATGALGTASNPFTTIQAASDSATSNQTIYVQGGTGTAYEGVVDNTSFHQSYTSSFSEIPGCEGHVFGGDTTRPTVFQSSLSPASNGQASAFRIVNGTGTVNGFAIDGVVPSTGLVDNDEQAIFAINASLIATNNVITNWDRAVTVFNGAGFTPTVIIEDNLFDFDPTSGPNPPDWWISLQSHNNGPNGISILSIQDNVIDPGSAGATGFNFNAQGTGVRMAESGGTPGNIQATGTISNNVIEGGAAITITVP